MKWEAIFWHKDYFYKDVSYSPSLLTQIVSLPIDGHRPRGPLGPEGGGRGPAPRRMQGKALNLTWFRGGGDPDYFLINLKSSWPRA